MPSRRRNLTLTGDTVDMLDALRLVLEDSAPPYLKDKVTDHLTVRTAFHALADVLKAGDVLDKAKVGREVVANIEPMRRGRPRKPKIGA